MAKNIKRSYFEMKLEHLYYYLPTLGTGSTAVSGPKVDFSDAKILLRTTGPSDHYPFIVVIEQREDNHPIRAYEFFSRTEFPYQNGVYRFPTIPYGFSLYASRGPRLYPLSPAAALEKLNPYTGDPQKAANAFRRFFAEMQEEFEWEQSNQKAEFQRKTKAEHSAEDQLNNLLDGHSARQSSGKGCYIATAVYGSYDCPPVWTLRRFRDNTLAAAWPGRAFIRFYYAVSPSLIRLLGKNPWFTAFWKRFLDRLVRRLNARGVESTPYSD